MPIRGIIFDLDETLVTSDLDYDAMRADLGLAADQLILESVNAMPVGPDRDQAMAVLDKYERAGALRSTLKPGVSEFLRQLTEANIPTGILTRNSRTATDLVCQTLNLIMSPVVTREDAAPKPDPAGLLWICQQWQLSVTEVVYVGDFLFDLQAAANAGMRSVLYCPGDRPAFAAQADFVITDYANAMDWVRKAT